MYLLDETLGAPCTTKKRALCDTFFKNHERKRVLEMNLRYLQNMPIYCPLRKYKLSTFLDYCYTFVIAHDFFTLKSMFGAWYKCAQNFLALNLTIIFIKPFTDNHVPSSMKYYFSIKLFLWNTSPLAYKTWCITDLLIQQLFVSYISLQMQPSPVTLCCGVVSYLIFMLFVLSTWNKVMANSLVFQSCLIHTDSFIP